MRSLELAFKLVILVAAGLGGLTILYLWERRELAASQMLDDVMDTGTDTGQIRRIGLKFGGRTREFTSPAEIVSAVHALRFCQRSDWEHGVSESSAGILTIDMLRGSHDYRIKRIGDFAVIKVLRESGSGWRVFDAALLRQLAETGTPAPVR